MKITHDGQEIEVYTAEEVTARETAAQSAARTAAEAEFQPKFDKVNTDLTDARKALGERTGEVKQFRKLNEDQAAKLNETERALYENQLMQHNRDVAAQEAATAIAKAADAAVIKAKANGNADLEKKMTDMWSIVGVSANTAEERENKAKLVIGALSTTEPNLVAQATGFTGSFAPPPRYGGGGNSGSGTSFADTPAGEAMAKDLGLLTRPPEKK